MLRICSFFLFVCTLAAEPADWIWSARYVLTANPQRPVIEGGAVAVRGERIVGVGTKAEIDKRFQARQRLDRPEAILAPGLINTHTHAAMSLFRGIADDLKLQDWLDKFIFPAEAKNVTADFVRWGTRLGCLEMLLGGTTTFTDMYYFEDVVAETAKEAGMRGVLGETIIGFPVADAKTPADALAFTEKFLQRFHDDSLIVPAVAPHALYTNSDETLKAARALANFILLDGQWATPTLRALRIARSASLIHTQCAATVRPLNTPSASSVAVGLVWRLACSSSFSFLVSERCMMRGALYLLASARAAFSVSSELV